MSELLEQEVLNKKSTTKKVKGSKKASIKKAQEAKVETAKLTGLREQQKKRIDKVDSSTNYQTRESNSLLQEAIILSEIIGKPRCKRPNRHRFY